MRGRRQTEAKAGERSGSAGSGVVAVLKPCVTTDIRGTLVFLGTGTSTGVPVVGCGCETCTSTDPRNHRTRCGVAVGLPGGVLLIDTPPELRLQLLRERIGMVDAVLFTHEHADHLFGLDDVRVFSSYSGAAMPLYCEAVVEARIRKAFDYCFASESGTGGYIPRLNFERIGLDPFRLLGADILPIRLQHGRGEVLGFRIGNVAYCTDTNHIPAESLPLLAGLDMLILDCLRIAPHYSHFSLDQALAAAEKIQAKRTLFTHMACGLEHVKTNALLPRGIELAYDGLRIPLS